MKKIITLSLVGVSLIYSIDGLSAGVSGLQQTINLARDLVVEKKRKEALELLVKFLAKPGVVAKDAALVKKQINAISRVFYTDKAQQLFETAVSLKRSDQALGLERLKEALQIEPDNFEILLEMGRIELRANHCGETLKIVESAKLLNNYSEDLLLLEQQANLCLKRFEKFVINRQMKKAGLQWQILDVEYYWLTDDRLKALEALNKLKESSNDFTEISYWSWLIYKQDCLKGMEFAKRYLTLCSNITVRAERSFAWEPQLCNRTAEVKSFIEDAKCGDKT